MMFYDMILNYTFYYVYLLLLLYFDGVLVHFFSDNALFSNKKRATNIIFV